MLLTSLLPVPLIVCIQYLHRLDSLPSAYAFYLGTAADLGLQEDRPQLHAVPRPSVSLTSKYFKSCSMAVTRINCLKQSLHTVRQEARRSHKNHNQ